MPPKQRRIHTDLGEHIRSLYPDIDASVREFGAVFDRIPKAQRGPVQDESQFCSDDDAQAMAQVQGHS